MPPDVVTPHMAGDLSLIGLFMQADILVKAIMVLLVLASIACWTVILEKSVRLARMRREVRALEAQVEGGLPSVNGLSGLPRRVVETGLAEWRERGEEFESRAERRERIERAMRTMSGEGLRAVEPGLPLLATVGSASPFVGLFGTVWGIMNSFTAIAHSQDTSLAVVAPGIAEALFATAIGLAAAIPAVVAYNKLATELGRLSQRLSAAIARMSAEMARRGDGRATKTEPRLAKAAE